MVFFPHSSTRDAFACYENDFNVFRIGLGIPRFKRLDLMRLPVRAVLAYKCIRSSSTDTHTHVSTRDMRREEGGIFLQTGDSNVNMIYV